MVMPRRHIPLDASPFGVKQKKAAPKDRLFTFGERSAQAASPRFGEGVNVTGTLE